MPEPSLRASPGRPALLAEPCSTSMQQLKCQTNMYNDSLNVSHVVALNFYKLSARLRRIDVPYCPACSAQHSTAEHSRAQHSTAQHSQHSTAQHSWSDKSDTVLCHDCEHDVVASLHSSRYAGLPGTPGSLHVLIHTLCARV